jgi:hypothetical protein
MKKLSALETFCLSAKVPENTALTRVVKACKNIERTHNFQKKILKK